MKKYVPIMVCALLLVGILAGGSLVNRSLEADLTTQNTKIAELKNQDAKYSVALDSEMTKAAKQNGGLDLQRVNADSAVVKTFVNKCFTWDSYQKYNSLREEIKKKYGLSDTDYFMMVFMPQIKNSRMNGKDYNIIDTNGYSLQASGFTMYVRNISGDLYSYYVLVNVTSTGSLSGGSADGQVVLECSVDQNGNLSRLSAFTVSR